MLSGGSLFLCTLLFIFSIGLTTGTLQNHLYVAQSPAYLDFQCNKCHETLNYKEFPLLILHTNGKTGRNLKWNCLKTMDSLNIPKLTLVLHLDSTLRTKKSLDDSYSCKINMTSGPVLSKLHNRLTNVYDSNAVHTLPTYRNKQDLISIDDLSNDLKSRSSSYKSLVYILGLDLESEDYLIDFAVADIIDRFKNNMNDNEKDNMLVYILTSEEIIDRERRQAPTTLSAAKNITNVAVFYNNNYPVTFNLLFWTSLIIALAVFYTAAYLWYMDPGSDTVIYRMTSQRIKKDQ